MEPSYVRRGHWLSGTVTAASGGQKFPKNIPFSPFHMEHRSGVQIPRKLVKFRPKVEKPFDFSPFQRGPRRKPKEFRGFSSRRKGVLRWHLIGGGGNKGYG
ncbi:hypothetical protein V6Z11_A13G106900 [Gossypium hirsutum]|uniref:Uncharacterized protein n=1 Tax=Gossypium hirsutum TaxID=3635 RepID=A0A1U8IHS8_GOSHI|nr:uncharacterized protein LOC107894702 [Gossypium hirsutum]